MLQERLSRRVRRQLLCILRALLSMRGRWELLHTVVCSVCQTGMVVSVFYRLPTEGYTQGGKFR
jgi:hypothetical protein